MKVAIVSHKGGVGKTTTAVHLAAYFQTLAPTILLDGDETQNALHHAARGIGLPFAVQPVETAAEALPRFAHAVIDVGQRPDLDTLRAAYSVCDLFVIPTVPDPYDLDSHGQTIAAMRQLGPDKFRVLLTRVAPYDLDQVQEVRQVMASWEAMTLATEIPELRAYRKAAGEGTTVNRVKDRSAKRAWAAYVAAGKELTA